VDTWKLSRANAEDSTSRRGFDGSGLRIRANAWDQTQDVTSKAEPSTSQDSAAYGTRFGLELDLEEGVPIARGESGLSQKGRDVGNASYYYATPRLVTRGTVFVGDKRIPVKGLSWVDREWSTSSLDDNVSGWDWVAMHIDFEDSDAETGRPVMDAKGQPDSKKRLSGGAVDNSALRGADIMLYRLRTERGGHSPFSEGAVTWVKQSTALGDPGDPRADTEGHARNERDAQNEVNQENVETVRQSDVRLDANAFTMRPERHATIDGIRYPVSFDVTIPALEGSLKLEAMADDQAWTQSIPYWEGAISVTGTIRGRAVRGTGYMELTGYGDGRTRARWR
jgi:predicted secreted hydrolase